MITETKYIILIAIAVIWSLPWKGYALWTSAKKGHLVWFIVLFIVNTLAILEIFYLVYIAKEKFEFLKKLKKKN